MSDLPLFTTYPSQAGVTYEYPDLAPSVDVPASRERAAELDRSGRWISWRKDILNILEPRGTRGATWQELGEILNLHHGQVSGRLSTMHAAGYIFALEATRNGSHPYVSATYRDMVDPRMRRDYPAKTKATRLRDTLDAVRLIAHDLEQSLTMPIEVRRAVVDRLLAALEVPK